MHSETQPYSTVLQYGCVALRMRFFPQNFGTIKRILPGSSSQSHREGPGTEVGELLDNTLSNPSFLLASKMAIKMREATCAAPLTS